MAEDTNVQLQRQIDALGERMDKGFAKLEALLSGNEERIRGLENREARCQPLITSRVDAAWRTIDEHSKQLDMLMQTVQSLQQSNKLLSWIGGIAGAALIMWIISQLLALITK